MPDPLLFPDATPRLGLPFLFAGQAQKEIFVNEALSRLDLLVHASVVDEVSQPPSAPQPGQCWLVGPGATGEWSGEDGHLAGWVGDAWQFAVPRPGMAVWDSATDQRLFFDGSWHRPPTPAAPTGGTTVDSQARTVIAELVASLVQAGILAPE